MKLRTKHLILSLLVIGMGGAFLYNFIMLHLHGALLITEPSPVILWTEIILFTVITGFGIYCWLGGERQ